MKDERGKIKSRLTITKHAQEMLDHRLYKYCNKTEVDMNIKLALEYYYWRYTTETIAFVVAELPNPVLISKKYGYGDTLIALIRDNVLITVFISPSVITNYDKFLFMKRTRTHNVFMMHEII